MERDTVDLGGCGSVSLVDVMPGVDADAAIVQAARISTGAGTKTPEEDEALIRYLMRNRHTTPFEMVEFKFHIKCPIYVARQHIRHRTASVNEQSGRYSVLEDEFHLPEPDEIRLQSSSNKQGSDDVGIDPAVASRFCDGLRDMVEESYDFYKTAVDQGMSREQARVCLPLCLMTEMYWKIDLHNLFHYLTLRMDHHAQKEIRVLAEGMYTLIKKRVPIACAAFEDYRLNSLTLSALEIAHLRARLGTAGPDETLPKLGKSERLQLDKKLDRLGLSVPAK